MEKVKPVWSVLVGAERYDYKYLNTIFKRCRPHYYSESVFHLKTQQDVGFPIEDGVKELLSR